METRSLSATQEVSHSTVGWKSHDNNFLGLQRCADGGLPPTEDYNDWTILRRSKLSIESWKVKDKRRGMLTKGPLLLHDNAPAHLAQVTQAVVKDMGFEQLSHPPYTRHTWHPVTYLFRHLKKHLSGTRFHDNNQIKQAIESYLNSMPREFYLTGIKELFDRCNKCIAVKGN